MLPFDTRLLIANLNGYGKKLADLAALHKTPIDNIDRLIDVVGNIHQLCNTIERLSEEDCEQAISFIETSQRNFDIHNGKVLESFSEGEARKSAQEIILPIKENFNDSTKHASSLINARLSDLKQAKEEKEYAPLLKKLEELFPPNSLRFQFGKPQGRLIVRFFDEKLCEQLNLSSLNTLAYMLQ